MRRLRQGIKCAEARALEGILPHLHSECCVSNYCKNHAYADWAETYGESQQVPRLSAIGKHSSARGYRAPMPEQFAPKVHGNRAVLNFKVLNKSADLALRF